MIDAIDAGILKDVANFVSTRKISTGEKWAWAAVTAVGLVAVVYYTYTKKQHAENEAERRELNAVQNALPST